MKPAVKKQRASTVVIQDQPLRLGLRDEEAGDIRSWPVARPSFARYATLVTKLAAARGTLDGGAPRLAAALSALAAVVEFLNADFPLLECDITQPLVSLVGALDRVRGGAPSPLFVPERRVQNRPGGTPFDVARGQLVAILNLRVAEGMQPGEAASSLAAELAESGFTSPDGKAITAGALRRWRENVQQGVAPPRVKEMFDRVMRDVERKSEGSSFQRQRGAAAYLKALLRTFPQSPPVPGKGQ